MDPNTGNPQGESDAMKKLEEDLQRVSQEASSATVTPVPEAPPIEQSVQPPVLPDVPPSAPMSPAPVVPVQQPETNIPTPEAIKKGSPLMVVAIVLALVAVLAVVVYVFGAKLLTPRQTPVPQAVISPSPIADETASWKTYISPTNAYTFKYPDGLASDTGAAGTGFESIRFTYVGPAQIASGRTQTELFDGYTFVVTNIGPSTQFEPLTEIAKQQENSKTNCQDISEVSRTLVNGLTAYSYSANCLGDFTNTYVSDGKNTYSIIEFYVGEDRVAYKAITALMLSTFRFTEAYVSGTPVPSPVGTPSGTPIVY